MVKTSCFVLTLLPGALACTLCKDGTVPGNAYLVSTAMVDDGQNVTCYNFLQDAAAISEDDDSCAVLQSLGAALCGCPIPESSPPCTLCSDGSPIPDPSKTIGQEAFTCGAIERYVQTDTRPGACQAYQATAGAYCGCPPPTPAAEESPSELCNLCESHSLPDPGRLARDDGHEIGGYRTCASIEFDATFFQSKCSSYRKQFSSHCCSPCISYISEGGIRQASHRTNHH